MEHQDRFLVQQRPAGVVNAHLWEFPNIEVAPDDSDACLKPVEERWVLHLPGKPLCTLQHNITRYRIRLDVFRVALNSEGKVSDPQDKWFTKKSLDRLPFSSAHKKVLAGL